MDAYDIFKKLTKGLKFKTNIIGVKSNQNADKINTKEIKKETEELVKDELVEALPSDDDTSDGSADDEEIKSEIEDADGKEEDFQLMDGLPVKEKKKKQKNKEKSETLKQKLELEEQNRFRNSHGIRVVGRGVPPALASFSSAQQYGVSARLLETVQRCGYSEPTPVQRQAMPCMLLKRQIFACAPTGSGKTAAFLVPVIHALSQSGATGCGPRSLVLCPTRELAKQTYREALRLTEGTDLRCSVLNKITDSKIKERESTFKKSDIVITTPNRLCFLMNQEGVNVSLDKVVWLVVDEADKLFEGSPEQEADFRQQMERVLTACDGKDRRIAMFSATHTPAVAKWCRHNMKGLVNITVGQRNAATNLVEQELLFCGNEAGKLLAFRQLVQKGLKPPVLVFVQSKDRAKQLFKELIYDGINVDVIHADRTQAQRDNVVRSFRLGRIWVLICTELLGRGIDFCGVSLVVNYDLPPSAIAYVHRVGRAGRAGQKGRAITFFTQDDVNNLRSIAAVMKQSGCQVPEYMLRLKQDHNARKRLLKKAPRRDQISTVLGKNRPEDKPETESKDGDSKGYKRDENSKGKKRKREDSKGSKGKEDSKGHKVKRVKKDLAAAATKLKRKNKVKKLNKK